MAAPYTYAQPEVEDVDEPDPTFEVLNDYTVDLENPLGVGGFGSVHVGCQKGTHKMVAVKAVSKARTQVAAERGDTHNSAEDILKIEIDAMRDLSETRHRNIPKFYGSWEDDLYVYLILQLCTGGELQDWLLRKSEQEVYTERAAAKVAYDVLQALRKCHELGIVHRDVKPPNLLYSAPPSDEGALLKLVDFGLAARHTADMPPLRDACGTLDFMAPEMLADEPSYGAKADVWSAGVLVYMLLSGSHPFRGPSQLATEERIKAALLPTDRAGEGIRGVSPEARAFVRALLALQPGARLSAKEARVLTMPVLSMRVLTMQSVCAQCVLHGAAPPQEAHWPHSLAVHA